MEALETPRGHAAERRITGRVLVVDDDGATRRSYRRMLAEGGAAVDEAEDAAQALVLLRQHAYDVVVSDIVMPGLSGVDLAHQARGVAPDVQVVLVTGMPSVGTAVGAMHEGAIRYLTKPVGPEELSDAVTAGLRAARVARVGRESAERDGVHDPGLPIDALDAALDGALEHAWMAYQPIVVARNKTRFGYEALLRSREPRLGGPQAILYAAERLGRVHDVGRRVRRLIAAAAREAAPGDVLFANLHALDLRDDDIFDADAPLTQVAPRVVLELTERATLEHADLAERVLRLRSLGFRIAIDDLGAGYSGLATMAELAPEVVKLDASLVRGVTHHPVRHRLVASLVDVCHDMSGLVVAEGVESAEERDAIVALGVDLLQGYRLGRPAPAFPPSTW
jgi:EAL domain-containing protein (putative c-di-GMP-specific phosphodiesterase class I)/ActR/RegA family two-component response regulator